MRNESGQRERVEAGVGKPEAAIHGVGHELEGELLDVELRQTRGVLLTLHLG